MGLVRVEEDKRDVMISDGAGGLIAGWPPTCNVKLPSVQVIR